MNRRRFLSLAGAMLVAPLAEAQPSRKVWRIGLLCANFCDSVSASTARPMDGFVEALRSAGYVDGNNVEIDYRGAGVADNRLDAVAMRLAGLRVDVMVAAGTSAAVRAAKKATQSIPIVMAAVTMRIKRASSLAFRDQAEM